MRRWFIKNSLELKDSLGLEAWLKNQPREVVRALSSRAALRVLPLIAGALQGKPQRLPFYGELTAAVFRAVATARAAGKYPAYVDEAAVSAATSAVAEFAAGLAIFRFGDADERIAGAVALTASAADTTRAAGAAVDAAQALPAADRGAVWIATRRDALSIASGAAAEALADAPLWLGAPPRWAADVWEDFCAALPTGQSWEVWIGWYEDRLAGSVRAEADELAFASVPEALWRLSAAAANQSIKEHLSEPPRRTKSTALVGSSGEAAELRRRRREWRRWFLEVGIVYLIAAAILAVWLVSGVNPIFQFMYLLDALGLMR